MALEKRLECRFIGNSLPTVPRASRSPRGKRSLKMKVMNNQMCAFELLATVAGNLLQESECSPSSSNASARKVQSTIIRDVQVKKKPLKLEYCDQRCRGEIPYVSGHSSRRSNYNYTSKGFPHGQTNKTTIKFEKLPMKTEERGEIDFRLNGIMLNKCSKEDQIELLDVKNHALVGIDSCMKASLSRDSVHNCSFPRCRDDVKIVCRDADERCSGVIPQKSKTFKAAPQCIRDQRIRKFMGPRYVKVDTSMKDGERSHTGGHMKPAFWRRKTRYTRQRSPRYSPFKRSLFKQNSFLISEQKVTSEGNSSSKSTNRNSVGSASGISSSVVGQESSFQSGDSHVKLSIKSFRVPELFIDIPETATVASLKRSVMEAMTAILGGGLRIGVLLQGKMVRDDNRTLLQTGICHDHKLDGLGFALEPNPTSAPPPLCPDDPLFLLPCSTSHSVTRYSALPSANPAISDTSPTLQVNKLSNFIEKINDPISRNNPDSTAMVTMSAEALAVDHVDRKCRQSELVHRRIRRPFTVSEVEALVQAVEKLGTGRWRDVKLRAFDNARHRTYVDLKDKWKTLVHTARISPQQRRGLPVPQELLDRVLSAHAYWSQQQEKHQRETCLLL
ncbi:hypothetical protein GIB67_034036 [Kingdonia uniflora]|uniref:Uncharacterized protein n=1 Tax=Kingdonia uniflora TaxID=39325 RepID=A0A7J7M641_9MAGN|nr:hypothetical protein GIB67_034036 [Kingdonia uniflora]